MTMKYSNIFYSIKFKLKFTQIGIFGLKIYHLATLVVRKLENTKTCLYIDGYENLQPPSLQKNNTANGLACYSTKFFLASKNALAYHNAENERKIQDAVEASVSVVESVTRRVCEKNRPRCSAAHFSGQNKCIPRTVEDIGQTFELGTYFCNLMKLPKVNNHQMSENSPKLVTLVVARENFKFKMMKLCRELA
jgi:hypothetical protein